MMSDCLGISALGLCAYDPSNPSVIYFSIGEAIAALSITLIIPQFLKPIYRFRLACQSVRLPHIYFLVFLGAAFVLVATTLPNIKIPRGSIIAYPVIWELIGGLLFFGAFGALVLAVLLPAKARPDAYRRFTQAAADFLAHANNQDQSDFSHDLLQNIERLIKTANFIRFRQDRSAFFDFQYRRKIDDARYASALLRLVAEPQFCETLVQSRPWDTAAMLHRISSGMLDCRAADNLIKEVGRQAIISQSSMLAREIGYKGFSAAPVLSRALFEDYFINRHYQPISGLEYGDFKNVDQDTVERLNYAHRSTLATVLKAGDYWGDQSLARIEEHLSSVSSDVHHQLRADRDKVDLVVSVYFGLTHLIDDTTKHLNSLDQITYDMLYVENVKERDYIIFDYLSEAIVEVTFSFANDFEGHEDVFWSMAMHIHRAVFGRFGGQPDGMNPLQQRVAIKLINKVKDNMEGYYPAVTRVLLSIIGPYEDPTSKNPKSASSLLRKAFYAELTRFPKLYENDSEKALGYLPKGVRYDPNSKSLIRIYRGGKEVSTNLQTLSIEPVSFEADAIRAKPSS